MNTISTRARRPLRPIALRLVGTWRGVRIDVTKVDREAPGGPTARVVGGTPGLPEGGSELGVDTPAGDVGTKVLRETSVDVCGLSEALSATLAKSPALVPPTVTLLIASGAVPALATVTVPGGSVLPAWGLPNTRRLGLTDARAVGCFVPLPWSAATCGLSDALSATDSVADRAPWVVG